MQKRTKMTEARIATHSRYLEVGTEKIYFDFTKTHFTEEEHTALIDEMREKDVLGEVKAMFEGGKINFTEKRSVLHTALRDNVILKCLENDKMECEGGNDLKFIAEEFFKIKGFVNLFENDDLKGVTGKTLKTIVNIGIGGSDLGPRIVCEALANYKLEGKEVHFVSNVDPAELSTVLSKVNLEETLFIVVSKTFTTQETISNAKLALKIFCDSVAADKIEIVFRHFVAVTANRDEAVKFGIETIFTMWDFVGGRFSLWSAAGISIALFLGFKNFTRLLAGASAVDENLREDPLKSAVVLHAVTEIFYGRRNYPTKCIVPYDHYLRNFYMHIQQVDMESNGKSALKNGVADYQTGMIVWGGVGTNSQHSFFQLIHQGTHKILLEFICPLLPFVEFETSTIDEPKILQNKTEDICSCKLNTIDVSADKNECSCIKKENGTQEGKSCEIKDTEKGMETKNTKSKSKSKKSSIKKTVDKVDESVTPDLSKQISHHSLVVANCIAQAEALFNGRKSEDPHKNFVGGKPSISIFYSKLTPEVLGALIAHYEHKVLVTGLVWEINSFDQFGVQLGKDVAGKVFDCLVGEGDLEAFSESTIKNIEIAKLAKK